MPSEDVAIVAAAFFPGEHVLEIQQLQAGNVHDTYLVSLAEGKTKIILQRVNTQVFQQPTLLMENLRLVTGHVAAALQKHGEPADCGWQQVAIHRTFDNQDYFFDSKGDLWRGLTYIHGASVHERVESPSHAFETGRALGMFHRLLSDFDPGLLHDTLPGFHIAPGYLARYDKLSAGRPEAHASEADYCRNFIAARRSMASVLEEAKHSGKLRNRVIHGDPKISNILIDNATGRAASLIDLDTVGSGLVHYDIADCLRSCCNRFGEETMDLNMVQFDLDICRMILTGYLQEAGSCLTDFDIAYLYDAILLLPFELGVRFFTDYLAGNMYFKTENATQNLCRALVQFTLTERITEQENAIRQLLQELSLAIG
jgi:Ser/Thr protein kinase RdoA (MazF antagonist)